MTFHILSGCTESNPGQPACLITFSVDSGGTLRLWCHQNPRQLGRVPLCQTVVVVVVPIMTKCPSVHPSSGLLFLTAAWQFAPVCQQPGAIKPMLSAVLSAGHRQWGSANSEAAETPCPAGGLVVVLQGPSAAHRKRDRTGSLCLAPGWPVQALMRAGTPANDSHFPPGLRRSRRPLRIRLRICSE